MAEYIDREKLINDGMEKGFCDWYDEIKYAQKADVIEREKIDKAIKEMKLEYLKHDAYANKLLAEYWINIAIKILKRNIGKGEE